MSRIAELVYEHIPRAVQFTELSELCDVFSGFAFSSDQFNSDGMGKPIIRIRDVNSGYTNTCFSGEYDERFLVANGDILIGMDGDFRAVRWTHGSALLNQRVCRLQDFAEGIEPNFVYYCIQGELDRIHGSIQGSTVKHLSANQLRFSRIPVPPIEVQREIVRILDQFTELEAELEAELESRRKQYSFYSDALLVGRDDVRHARLGEVATIVRGASPRPIRSFISEATDSVPWIKIGDVPENGKYITGTAQRVSPAGASKSRSVRPGDFVLSNSMSFGRPYISKIDGCIHDGWLAISDYEATFTSDYLYYLLRSTPVQRQFSRLASSGTVKNLKADTVRSVVVPVPDLQDQERSTRFLNQFDLLINDLADGLPAELAARRKQYEYYRDRLLSFEELAA